MQGSAKQKKENSLALANAILGSLAGVATLWSARQTWMLAHPTAYYTLSATTFPPAAVALAYLFARGAAASALMLLAKWRSKGQGGARLGQALLE